MNSYDVIERRGIVGIITKVEGNKYHIMFEYGQFNVDMAVYTYKDILLFRRIG